MKRIGGRLGVALFTFGLGVWVAWVAAPVPQVPVVEIESPRPSQRINRPVSITISEPVTIVLIRSYKNSHAFILAEFRVTNISSEPVAYAGEYSEPNWNRYYSVKRKSEVVRSDRSCGSGIAGYTLSPGKSVTFRVVAGEEPGNVQVGFDFFLGREKLKRTIWSEEVYVGGVRP